jgi:hypothetical protein
LPPPNCYSAAELSYPNPRVMLRRMPWA